MAQGSERRGTSWLSVRETAYPMCNIGAGEGWLHPPSILWRPALRRRSRAGGLHPFPRGGAS